MDRIIFTLVLFCPISLFAQSWEGDGSLEKVEVEIIKERQVSVPVANRNFEKIPPRPIEPIKPEIVYRFKKFDVETPEYHPAIRPLRLKQEEIDKFNGNYISAGYGNFTAPYLEGYFNSKRNRNSYYGAHIYHQSYGKGPIDGANSASGTTEIELFGKAFTNKLVSGANFGFENLTTYFYGYENSPVIDRALFKQQYNVYSVSADIGNSNKSDYNFRFTGGFSYLEDNYKAAESEVDMLFETDYKFAEDKKLSLKANYFLIARKDEFVDADPRHLLKINPAFKFDPVDKLSLSIGINTAIENDTIGKKSFHLYPNILADYTLGELFSAFVNVTGDMDKVALHTIIRENLWTAPNVSIFHTNRSIDFSGGLKGQLGKTGAFTIGGAYANLVHWYFYENGFPDRTKFILNYEGGNTGRVNWFTELSYEKSKFIKLRIRGDYYFYSADTLAVISHKPLYRVDGAATFNVYDKLHININFIVQGGMKALDFQLGRVLDLKEAIDLNIRADYFVSKQFTLFVRMNNILSTEYPVFIHYPVRGFQATGGISWSF